MAKGSADTGAWGHAESQAQKAGRPPRWGQMSVIATATAALQTTMSATSARSCPPYLDNVTGGVCQAVQGLAFVAIASQRCFGVLKLLSQYLNGIG